MELNCGGIVRSTMHQVLRYGARARCDNYTLIFASTACTWSMLLHGLPCVTSFFCIIYAMHHTEQHGVILYSACIGNSLGVRVPGCEYVTLGRAKDSHHGGCTCTVPRLQRAKYAYRVHRRRKRSYACYTTEINAARLILTYR